MLLYQAISFCAPSFLCAVLWFDLIFDVQVFPCLGKTACPADVLNIIRTYYKRATTDSAPMGYLVALVMMIGLMGMSCEVYDEKNFPRSRSISSLLLMVGPISLALVRTLPNAMQLGSGKDSLELQSTLAKSIFFDHIACLAFVLAALLIQLSMTTV